MYVDVRKSRRSIENFDLSYWRYTFFSQNDLNFFGVLGEKIHIFITKGQNFQLIVGFSSQLHTLKLRIIRFIKFTSRTVKYQKYQFLIICHKMCITLRISKNQNYLISEGHSSYSKCNSICLMCSNVPQKILSKRSYPIP